MPGTLENRPEPAAVHAPLLGLLRREPAPLFALLDAARDPRVLELLRVARQPYQSLYEGPPAETLADFAPYLVDLSSPSPLLEILLAEGWGRSWGIYLTCRQSFLAVRKHFRRFLFVQMEDHKDHYFRFYDPRVLRSFLPVCTPEQVQQLFGPVAAFLVEAAKSATLLRFTGRPLGLHKETVRF
jgi:hypothetical protein